MPSSRERRAGRRDDKSAHARIGLSPLVLALVTAVMIAGCRSKVEPPPVVVAGPDSPSESPETAADAPQSDASTPDSSDRQAERTEPSSDDDSPATAKPDERVDDSALPPEAATNDSPEDNDIEGQPSEDVSQPTEPAPELAGERFLLLPAGGPLLVEVQLFIADQPVGTAFDQVIANALSLADTNQDGVVTWDELTQSPVFRYGQLGNVEINNEAERKQMIRMYDINRNERVDREEVPRFVTRNAGGSRPFSMKSSNYYREVNRLDSPVRRRLDADVDGWIDTDEIVKAPRVLRTRDGDGNDILGVEDFRLTGDGMTQPLIQRRTTEPDGAIHVTERLDARYVLFTFQELYSFGAELSPGDFPRVPGFFHELDADGDGSIALEEVARLREIPPHIRLRIDFDLPMDAARLDQEEAATEPEGSTDSNLTRIQLVELSPEVAPQAEIVAESSGRLLLRWPDLRLEFFANDYAPLTNRRGQVAMILEELDENSDGYLVEDEIPEGRLGGSFEELDQNEDGKVYSEEIERYLSGQGSAVQSQILCRAGFSADALFLALDTTGDRRLTSRELDAASSLLQSLDRNEDGLIAVREIPDAMLVGFARGDAQRGDLLFAPPASGAEADGLGSDTPEWFRGMDVNLDGDVSRSEFLGTAEQFQRIDIDQDGYLDPVESRSAESAQ